MTIEAGARCGMVAPDDVTLNYLKGRPNAPDDASWPAAEAFWRSLPSDADAKFDREVTLDAALIQPMATWGTSPEEGAGVAEMVPDPT